MAAQYDTVGNKYEQFKDTAPLPIPERHTFLKLVGDLHGQRALDLACGAGYYTRLLKQQGAENVIGVDVSPEMVAIARQREQEHRQGIQYQVANAAQLPHLGDFHLVTAIYLLNYAFTRDELLGMCRGAYSNLVEGGRFIAFTIDPHFVLEKGNWGKYGFEVLGERLEGERHVARARFHSSPPADVDYCRWSTSTYEWAMTQAGFRQLEWRHFEIPPEAVEKFGAEFWREYRENPLLVALTGRR
ncbi:class I SAM-dependent methyltransferase [Cystobacter fuscus]|uniref:class I SAM-dependent methyltransferase n=1 Tax=Cystobacter fuscus TaxID=43 RepID=UPI002B31F5A8|nr:class I SAM-dependent methyltransferase [Cystobacter fuscus]